MQNLVIRALPGIGALLAVAAFAAPTQAAPPVNAQQAQDACIDYLLQTIRAMPEGTYLEAQPDAGRPTSPGSVLPTGTGSAFFPRAEYYGISYKLLGDSSQSLVDDIESAWNTIGWPPSRKPPLSNGVFATQAYPADGYLLNATIASVVTLSCETDQTFPGGGPAAAPAPWTLVQ
ncbi:hypothetical protein [Nocardia sp. NPDC050175]|uniref:hypothetical protein n=1 Tax=Nocardia sp. NPDC050175 TaxID=3364317 RepID=UPI0037AA85D0